jgi:uncharacterized protein (TIGR02001 family)
MTNFRLSWRELCSYSASISFMDDRRPNIPMHTKLSFSCLAALSFGAALAVAQTAVPAPAPASPSVSVTATASLVSNYMFRGMRLNGPGFQPSVEVAAGSLTAGVWSNFPIDDKVPGSSDPEVDLYGSYTFALSDNASIAPGFTAYLFPKADEALGFYKSTFEPNIAFNYTVQGLKLTPKFYYDTVLEGATYELTAFYALPLKDLGSELDFTATIGTYKLKEFANNSVPATKAWGDYWLVGVAMPFQLAANQKLTVGVAYTEGRDAFTKTGNLGRSVNAGAIGRAVVSLSYAFSF